jgi:hypothetical protein
MYAFDVNPVGDAFALSDKGKITELKALPFNSKYGKMFQVFVAYLKQLEIEEQILSEKELSALQPFIDPNANITKKYISNNTLYSNTNSKHQPTKDIHNIVQLTALRYLSNIPVIGYYTYTDSVKNYNAEDHLALHIKCQACNKEFICDYYDLERVRYSGSKVFIRCECEHENCF